MAANATSWTKGRSGNPSGKAKLATSRRSLRAALSAPAEPGSSETLMDWWCADLIASAVTFDDRLAVLRFLDGSQPTPNDLNLQVENAGGIVIAGATLDGRPTGTLRHDSDPDDDDGAIDLALWLIGGDG